MTDQQHPITPPPELFKQWEDDILSERDNVDHVLDCAWRDGFRAGANQELEACCEWLDEVGYAEIRLCGNDLRIDRRPQPKTLAEEALEAIEAERAEVALVNYKVIHAALKRLQELEGQGDD